MDVFVLFLRVVAWGALAYSGLVIGSITVGRMAETEADRLLDAIAGRKWNSRAPHVVVVFLAAAWLYASWGL